MAALLQPATTNSSANAAAPTQPQTAPAGDTIKTAEDLLDALEKADANLQSLTADIQYDKIDGVTEDRQIRKGKVFFLDETDSKKPAAAGEPKPGAAKRSRKFSVRFDSLQLNDRLEPPEEKLFIFDGEWLIEVNSKEKDMIKRQVTVPGAAFDPLKIGEGPLPLPIGQKKADMLARFKVMLLPATDGLSGEDAQETGVLQNFVKGSYQLKLVPNPGTPEAEKFGEIRLWYRETDGAEGGKRLLPRMARTTTPTKSPNISIVRMINVKTNVPIEPKMMAVEAPGKDWNVHIDSLDAPAGPEHAAGPNAVAPGK